MHDGGPKSANFFTGYPHMRLGIFCHSLSMEAIPTIDVGANRTFTPYLTRCIGANDLVCRIILICNGANGYSSVNMSVCIGANGHFQRFFPFASVQMGKFVNLFHLHRCKLIISPFFSICIGANEEFRRFIPFASLKMVFYIGFLHLHRCKQT
jgi:hypothetical protein